ncbi:protein max-like isoform X2 [Rhopilema esculentum]|uniref:protein max-like isoform X2 n=1 Tax=Rhopilema esculentum TaxID=499914 RepID=UPI0031DEA839
MSDEDKDIDVESDDADKRAHHNALERKRRDHIKDSFSGLRDSIPSLQGEKASRAQILNKATDYIQYMRRKNHTHQADIDELKRQNMILDQQGNDFALNFYKLQWFTQAPLSVRQLEKARAAGNLTIDSSTAAILSNDPSILTDDVLSDGSLKTEDALMAVNHDSVATDTMNDHDYGTVAKRLKTET